MRVAGKQMGEQKNMKAAREHLRHRSVAQRDALLTCFFENSKGEEGYMGASR